MLELKGIFTPPGNPRHFTQPTACRRSPVDPAITYSSPSADKIGPMSLLV
jgi:hypothetical protein